ncbi:MAG: hydrogenase maturation protease [Verrucomicrobia bacterium]|nr:hydrogenase maturation protease [Verrucomicrobiota bacterium]
MKSEPPHVGGYRAEEGSSSFPILVIGYGNELRGDDAVGPQAARAVSDWNLPQVRALALAQLTPELAEAISQARQVIFVDAAADAEKPTATAQAIGPSPETPALGHASDPRWLLALAKSLFGRCPPAWLVEIPARSFGFGQPLSVEAQQGAEIGLGLIRRICVPQET